jgi:hypothetical protein
MCSDTSPVSHGSSDAFQTRIPDRVGGRRARRCGRSAAGTPRRETPALRSRQGRELLRRDVRHPLAKPERGRILSQRGRAAGPIALLAERALWRAPSEREVTQEFMFWLSPPTGAEHVAEVKVEVLRVGSDDRRRERRSRHVWDVL